MTTWTLGSEAEGLVIQVTAVQVGDNVEFTVQVLYGSANVNALYWSDGDGVKESSLTNFTGAKSENSLNMNGTDVVWDGGYKLSDAGLGKTPPPSYLTANPDDAYGDSITFTVSNLTIADFETLGIRATSTSTAGGSIKWVAYEPDSGNVPPVANDDSATAQEAGGIANGTPGIDPSGNVLGNDSDENPTSLQVTAVRTGAESGSGTGGTVGSALQGLYGTLTLNADGSYTYQVDQENPLVQALTPTDSLTEYFTYTVTDGGGLSDSATLTITINGRNDAPVVSVNGEGSFISGGSAELIDNTIGVTDVDNSTLASAVITIENFRSGDVLHFTDQPGITESYNSSTGVLTLTGTALLDDYRTALESITFSTTSSDATTRTIRYVLNDGTDDGAPDTGTMTIVVLGADPSDGTDNADNPDTITGATNLGSGDDTFTGSGNSNDFVAGGADNDDLDGRAGNDTLYGGSGNDTLAGGAGNDRLYGDAGNDSLDGSGGADTLYGGSGDDTLADSGGDDRLYGDAGNDSLDGSGGADTLHGGSGSDTLAGGGGIDQLYGDAGNDSLAGGADSDTLYGGSGNDILVGNDEADIIYGGFGADSLTGGAGADTFVFLSVSDRKDTLADFNPLEDKIDLTAIFSGSETLQDLLDANRILLQQVDADGDSTADDVRILIDLDGSNPADPDVGPIAPVVLVDVLNTTLGQLNNTNLLV